MTSRDHPGYVWGCDGLRRAEPLTREDLGQHIDGPRPGYRAMERTAATVKQRSDETNQTPAEQAAHTVKSIVAGALADQKAALEIEAQRARAKLQRELEATHTFVKTIVTVEHVSADGLTRRVEHQWEAPKIEAKYHLDTPRNSYGYGYPGAAITLTLANPMDLLARAKAGHNGR